MSREIKIVLAFQALFFIALATLIISSKKEVAPREEVLPAIAVEETSVATPTASVKMIVSTPTPLVNPVGTL